MNDGWLWDSILKTAARPSPMSTAPAVSPGPRRPRGPSARPPSPRAGPPARRSRGRRTPCRERLDHRFEHHQPVHAPERQLAGALGVRHQPDHVAPLVAEARNVRERSVRVRLGRDRAGRVAVAEDALAPALEPIEDLGWREVVAVAARDGDSQHLALAAG